jgi:hypothetical protein
MARGLGCLGKSDPLDKVFHRVGGERSSSL